MAERKILSDAGIRALRERAKKAGVAKWISDGAVPRSHGGLQLHVHPNGTPRWYWRYTKPDGSKPRIAIGAFTAEKRDGAFTLSQAREEVAKLAALYRAPETRDVRDHLAGEA